ncbi:TetR/AcrR family transcriptional regulator [Desulfosporosinus metallidurans]|uniref:Transcriptional regulator, TetR family n=1 Tax=Desulfosporosinus metallidurans TaxID=1888891 RepID=A0A1Q8QFE3_9FIRM|nr:TetR/AcrR family transcriptional regulator [Desulfosporosinus metallidurans]OLN26073.1 Transcriptional regulator, TetR family [Desulfosporosinus metallidurans]
MNDKKADIFNYGRELFSSKGFKDTNVSEITKMAGIGVGTFYNYYSSKEKLFMEIFLEENVKLKKRIMESIDLDGDPLKVVNELMFLNVSGMNSNPILREWYNRDVFSKLEQHYRQENGIKYVDFLYNSFVELVKKWQVEGKMRDDIDCEFIMAIFAALINIDTHKEEIGIEYFPHILDYLAEFVIKGLTDYQK